MCVFLHIYTSRSRAVDARAPHAACAAASKNGKAGCGARGPRVGHLPAASAQVGSHVGEPRAGPGERKRWASLADCWLGLVSASARCREPPPPPPPGLGRGRASW